MYPDKPAASLRVVTAQPNMLRFIPRVPPIGITKRPKLRLPVAIVEKLTSHMTATITQP